MKTKSFTFLLPEELYAVLRELAEKNERTASGELRIAIKNHLDGQAEAASDGEV